MDMLQTKKGFTTGILKTAIIGIVLFTVLLSVYATMLPTAQAAGNDLNRTGIPFGSFFASNGIIWMLVALGIVLLALGYFLGGKGGMK